MPFVRSVWTANFRTCTEVSIKLARLVALISATVLLLTGGWYVSQEDSPSSAELRDILGCSILPALMVRALGCCATSVLLRGHPYRWVLGNVCLAIALRALLTLFGVDLGFALCVVGSIIMISVCDWFATDHTPRR